MILCEPMKEEDAKFVQDVDFYERVIRSLDDQSDEVVIILSVEMLQKAGIEVGNKLLITARPNELVIRKE